MKKLQTKLLAHNKRLGVTANQIKERKVPNVYPIGTRAVYCLCKGYKVSDSHKWKMKLFFEQLENADNENESKNFPKLG